VQRFQTILLSLLVLILMPFSAIALDKADNDAALVEAGLDTQENDNIMIRQIQPITGFHILTVAGQDINATFLEETLGEPHGAIVLFHDQGEDLESRGIVTPLRYEMLQYGWSTLSVTLDYPFTPSIVLAIEPEIDPSTASGSAPATSKDEATSTETASSTNTNLAITDEVKKDEPPVLPPITNKQRIEAAVEFLKAKDIKRIIFIGHGTGGIEAIDSLATIATPISALILVGTPSLANNDEFKTFEQPILDIYGDQDLEGVVAAVKDRKVVMKRSDNIQYTSREVIGANHVFYGLEPMLISTVRGWLHATFVKQEKSE
jgi:predicted alpha/beta-hydrolase family hydrolase